MCELIDLFFDVGAVGFSSSEPFNPAVAFDAELKLLIEVGIAEQVVLNGGPNSWVLDREVLSKIKTSCLPYFFLQASK